MTGRCNYYYYYYARGPQPETWLSGFFLSVASGTLSTVRTLQSTNPPRGGCGDLLLLRTRVQFRYTTKKFGAEAGCRDISYSNPRRGPRALHPSYEKKRSTPILKHYGPIIFGI